MEAIFGGFIKRDGTKFSCRCVSVVQSIHYSYVKLFVALFLRILMV